MREYYTNSVYIMTVNAKEIYRSIPGTKEDGTKEDGKKEPLKEEEYYYYYNRRLPKEVFEARKGIRHYFPATALPLSMDRIRLQWLLEDTKEFANYGFVPQNLITGMKNCPNTLAEAEQVRFTNVIIDVDFGNGPKMREKKADGEKKAATDAAMDTAESAEKDTAKGAEKDTGKDTEEVSSQKIREILYRDGFHMLCIMTDGREKECHFVEYKRSAGSAKAGRHLFILEELAEPMKQWTWLGLENWQQVMTAGGITNGKAYEALVNSDIEKFVSIRKEQILLISDIEHSFTTEAKVVHYKDEQIRVETESEFQTSTNLFDGQALLDTELFAGHCRKHEKVIPGMMLLRNHFFKTCAFHTNLQQFLKEQFLDEEGHPLEKITDMFGRELLTKDIRMITTPSSMKFLKLADAIFPQLPEEFRERYGDEPDETTRKKAVYEYWLSYIDPKEGEGAGNEAFAGAFGVVKHESVSRWGHGRFARLSYQMVNSLPFSRADIQKLLEPDGRYLHMIQSNYKDRMIADAIADLTDPLTRLEEKLKPQIDSTDHDWFAPFADEADKGLGERIKDFAGLMKLLQREGRKDTENYPETIAHLEAARTGVKSIVNNRGDWKKKILPEVDKGKRDAREAGELLLERLAAVKEELGSAETGLRARYEFQNAAFMHHLGMSKKSVSAEFIKNMMTVSDTFLRTDLFRDYRYDIVSEYKRSLYRGKLKVPGDYYVLCSLPLEMLYHAIGRFDGEVVTVKDSEKKDLQLPTLRDGEVWNQTLQNAKAKDAVIFRNPHICASSVVIVKQKEIPDLMKYFRLGSHVLVVSPWESNILARLAGADFDSDTVLCTTDRTVMKRAKEVKDFPVVYQCLAKDLQEQRGEKETPEQKKEMPLAEIDHLLSVNKVGEIVNLSQLLNCCFWTDYYKRKKAERGAEQIRKDALYDKILTLSVLSEIEIDKAKHPEYMGISMKKVLQTIRDDEEIAGRIMIKLPESKKIVPVYPLFWKYIAPGKVNAIREKAKEDLADWEEARKKAEKDLADWEEARKKAEKDLAVWEEARTKFCCPMSILMEELDKGFKVPGEPRNSEISIETLLPTESDVPCWEKLKELAELIRGFEPLLKSQGTESGEEAEDNGAEAPDDIDEETENGTAEEAALGHRDLILAKVLELGLTQKEIYDTVRILHGPKDSKESQEHQEILKSLKRRRILVMSALCLAYPEEFHRVFSEVEEVQRYFLQRERGGSEPTGEENRIDLLNRRIWIWGRPMIKDRDLRLEPGTAAPSGEEPDPQ